MSSSFDPCRFGFVLLRQFQIPENIKVYEYHNHPKVDGSHDFYRLNGYLTQDRDFVTIWFGLLEPGFLCQWLEERGIEPPDYNESLFRGYIESEEQASHILRALRPLGWRPQRVWEDPVRGIACDLLPRAE